MTKSNPLFVDSTVLHGDRIGTQIELNRILLYDEEVVSVVITNHLGETQAVSLKPDEEGVGYTTRVWLSHQKSISYNFVIEKNGKLVFQSQVAEIRAQYALIEDWEPTFDPQPVRPPPVTPERPKRPVFHDTKLYEDSPRAFSTIMEKWGL